MTHQPKIAKYSVKCVKIHDGDLDDPRLFARLNECPRVALTTEDVDRNLLDRLPS